MCIGFDTARNIAADAINKINETAEAHHRIFIVEVMGRNSGQLALSSALASGAEIVIIPERDPAQRDRINRIANLLKAGFDAGRSHAVMVVAEGVSDTVSTDSLRFSEHLEIEFAESLRRMYPPDEDIPDIRLVVLSHIQRGGCPTVADRILAARFGEAAVKALVDWDKNPGPKMVALVGNEIEPKDISVVDNQCLHRAAQDKLLSLYALQKTLARVEPLRHDQPILDPPDE